MLISHVALGLNVVGFLGALLLSGVYSQRFDFSTTLILFIVAMLLGCLIVALERHLKNRYVKSFRGKLHRQRASNHRALGLMLMLAISYSIFSVFQALEGRSFAWLVTADFQKSYLSGVTLFIILMVLATGVFRSQSRLNIVLTVTLLGAVSLLAVKGITVSFGLLALLRFSSGSRASISLKHISLLSLFALLVFFGSYYFSYRQHSNLDSYIILRIIAEKFIFYMSAGYYGFGLESYGALDSTNLANVFSPINNVFVNWLGGEKYFPGGGHYYVLETRGFLTQQTNVRTLLGTLLLAGDTLYESVLAIFSIYSLIFVTFVLYYVRRRDFWLAPQLGLFLCLYVYGFFEYYYWHSFVFYIIIIGFLFDLLSKPLISHSLRKLDHV